MGELLHHTIDMRWGKGGDAVPQNCCIPPLQQHTKASPEVVDGFTLVLRARAAPSFLTSRSPAPCHPPNDSAARGMKAMPCLLQTIGQKYRRLELNFDPRKDQTSWNVNLTERILIEYWRKKKSPN